MCDQCDRPEYERAVKISCVERVPVHRSSYAAAVPSSCSPPQRQAHQRAPRWLRHVPDSRRCFFSLPCTPVLTPSPAEALDQWFENLQNYEATLVRFSPSLFALRSFPCRKTWPLPPSMSTSKKSSAPSSSVSLFFLLFSRSCSHRVQGPLRSRAHRRPLQPSPAFNPGSDPFLHHRPPADGQGRPHDCPPQPRRGLHAEPDGGVLCPLDPRPQHPALPHSTRLCSEPPVPRSRQQQLQLPLSRFSRKHSLCRSFLFRRCRNSGPPARQAQGKRCCCPPSPHLRSRLGFRSSRCPCLLGCRPHPRPGFRVQLRLPGKRHLPSQEQRLFRLPSFSPPRSCRNRG